MKLQSFNKRRTLGRWELEVYDSDPPIWFSETNKPVAYGELIYLETKQPFCGKVLCSNASFHSHMACEMLARKLRRLLPSAEIVMVHWFYRGRKRYCSEWRV